MSHEITNNMIAWKGETPWHGLGFKVAADATGDQMLTVAGLNWAVQRRMIAMKSGDGKGTLQVDPLRFYRAIVRSDTDRVFQVAKAKYQPVQNAEIVNFFREYCEAGHATMETVGGLKGGAIVWALARLNGGTGIKLGGVDELRGYMLLATSHDGSLRTIGKPTQTRVVCWNTLSAAIGEKATREFRMKHSRKFDAAAKEEAREAMGMAIESIQKTNETMQKLSKVHIDQKGRIEFIDRLLGGQSILEAVVDEHQAAQGDLLDSIISTHHSGQEEEDRRMSRVGKAILDAILDSPGSNLPTAKDTLWGAINGVTFYADHVRGRSQDTRLQNAWFGQTDQLKADAVQVALQMAG